MTFRHPGAVFPTAVFLSVIILSLGLGAAQTVIKELNFATDLLFSEQAYYAAESGVESALIDLDKRPVQHRIVGVENLGEEGSFEPFIFNQNVAGDDFDFTIPPLASQRFRLLRDRTADLVYSPVLASEFDIEVTPSGESWQWKVLCQNGAGETASLQNTLDTGSYPNFLATQPGKEGNGLANSFGTWISDKDDTSCFFSVQSLSEATNLEFVFTPRNTIAPPIATVRSTGRAGNRQKRIEFDYAQQNLGGLFDFVFFHWEG